MKMPSAMQHSFSEVPAADIPRSVFDRKRTYKTMFNSAYLIPFFKDEVLPGDTYNVRATLFTRMPSALNVPLMDNLYLDTFYFYVPNRLLWTNWKKFCGEQVNEGDSTSYTVPVFTAYSPSAESLSDYMGIPPIGASTVSHISLFHRAYNLIWNEWFRDSNLQDAVTVDTDDGPDSIADYVLLKRGKRHDYFTSCLPWPQRGTAQTISLGTSAAVVSDGTTPVFAPQSGNAFGDGKLWATVSGGRMFRWKTEGTPTDGVEVKFDDGVNMNTGLEVDLSGASAATINSLRQSFQIQKMYERDARGGARYTEIVHAHFGVISPDARLQRPEFLGGNSTPITVSTVAQTSAADAQPTPLGDLAAFAHGASVGEGFTKSFTEHGVILGLCMVRADLTYQQGLHRMFSRSTRLDFYWPALAHIGEQAVLNKEIYLQGSGNPTEDADVFGYQERWAEYRYGVSEITGKLRSTYATPLDAWHLAQKFTSLPTLGSTFITEAPPITRIIAVTDEPEFVLDAFIECKTVRPMPTYSVPGLIDHF